MCSSSAYEVRVVVGLSYMLDMPIVVLLTKFGRAFWGMQKLADMRVAK